MRTTALLTDKYNVQFDLAAHTAKIAYTRPQAKHTHRSTSLLFLEELCDSLPLSNKFIMSHRGPNVCSFNTGKMRKEHLFWVQ